MSGVEPLQCDACRTRCREAFQAGTHRYCRTCVRAATTPGDWTLVMTQASYLAKPRDYRGTRNGYPCCLVMDPHDGATTSAPVTFVEAQP